MKSEHCIHTISQTTALHPYGLPPWIVAATNQCLRWMERSRQRNHLATLDDDALDDIGLTRADVWTEVNKPFWQA